MNDDSGIQPVCTRLPLAMGDDGQPYLAADAVSTLFRAMAEVIRGHRNEDGEIDIVAHILEMEADALDCRAIEHTL
ncbi:hypothetical protein ACFQ2B_27720 [Streptomyces stramineus]|uniref:Uncharacterized protein n=1 Tax=Streptomyces stramineus TaxID=173861 RepID=A0ABN0ZNQ0_9ACTN